MNITAYLQRFLRTVEIAAFTTIVNGVVTQAMEFDGRHALHDTVRTKNDSKLGRASPDFGSLAGPAGQPTEQSRSADAKKQIRLLARAAEYEAYLFSLRQWIHVDSDPTSYAGMPR